MLRFWLSWLVLLPSLAFAAPNGAQLFQQNCAVCHGEHGRGGVGVPLALPSFQSSVDNAYLAKTIRLGRPGRVMPAFPSLSDAEVNAIVHYVRSFTHVKPPEFSAAPVKGDVQQGAKLFAANCASCHGDRGQGGAGTGVTFSRPRNLPIIPPALNNPGFQAAATDAQIRYTLIHGRQGTPMVSFRAKGLSDRQIDNIVAYVRTLKRGPVEEHENEPPMLVEESSSSFEATIKSVRQAIIGANFLMIREQSLDYGLVPKDKENTREHILYFCNFPFLNKALGIDPRVGLFLPCRVTVVERQGKVYVMAINPLKLSHLFNNDELNELCKHMHDVYRQVLDEATL
ncbi:MAG: c-type cytochrome [Gammaproteobacteria bacterium]|jgi:cytochrome c oxidase cbb3-type subunit III